MLKRLEYADLPNYMGKKLYKEQLSDIMDTKIILADASRDTEGKSFGTLVFFGTDYDEEILKQIRYSKKPAIYIHNIKDIDENGEILHYVE